MMKFKEFARKRAIAKNRQRIKAEALNKIAKIHNDRFVIKMDRWDECTRLEMRDSLVNEVINRMNWELKEAKYEEQKETKRLKKSGHEPTKELTE